MYAGLFGVGCVLSLANPIWGVVNYMMVYQLYPSDKWWGKPLAAFGVRFSLVAVAFTLVGMITARKHVPVCKPGMTLWEWGLVGLVVIAGFMLVAGTSYDRTSQYAFEKLWKMFLFVLIFVRLASTRTNLRFVLWALVAGSLYLGYDAYTAPDSSFWLGRLDTIGGPDFSTTSGAAAHLSAMLPIIGMVFLISRRWSWRIIAMVAGALTVNAVVLCRTRSAFIGLICGVLVAFLAAPRAKRYRIHALLVCGGLLAFCLTDNHFWDRMETLTDKTTLETDTATMSRTDIWKISLTMLMDHPLGVGPGNFPKMIGKYDWRYHKRSTHNTVVVCFTELGFAGGILFTLLLFGSLRYLYLSSKLAEQSSDPVETKLMTYGLLVALVTYFVTGLGTERFYCESFWWVMALPLCLYRVVVREATAAASAAVPALWEESDIEEPYVYATGPQLQA